MRVGGGALLSELDEATQRHGLAVPGGQISHTGVGGLTLGGGIGWLMRHHGLTVDSLLAAEVVLADGEIVRASADEHADLFWALRGGGGEFGVVTRFEFRAHRVGPTVLGGMLVYPWEQARAAFQATRALMADAPDALTAFAVLVTAPPQAPFPAEHHGRPVAVVAVAWSGDLEEGDRVLAPLRAGCPPLVDLVAPMPFVALQSMLDQTAPAGLRYYDKLHFLPEVSDGFIEALLARFADVPTPQSHVMTDGWAARSTASRPATPRSATAPRARSPGSSAAPATMPSSPRPTGCAACSTPPRRSRAPACTSTRSTRAGRSVTPTPTRSGAPDRGQAALRPGGVFDAHGIGR